MLALPPQRCRDDERKKPPAPVDEDEEFLIGGAEHHHQFADFGDGNLLDCIDFDDLFAEVEGEEGGLLLPGLEMVVDRGVAGEVSASGDGNELEMSGVSDAAERAGNSDSVNGAEDEDEGKPPASGGRKGAGKKSSSSSAQSKSRHRHSPPQGKRKAKVDWTPDLHRKFVQAVEKLGLDKAVPSKILEIMGIECLTRHNIASHLQKYRSHRKHLLAREAEAASLNHQRRQIYGGGKAELSPWISGGGPAMGFPPPVAARPVQIPLRPLHVWGHPPVDQSTWLQHTIHPLPAPPRPPWPPVALPYSMPPLLAPPLDPSSYWNPHHHQVPNAVMPGTPCFPQPCGFTGLMAGPPVTGIPSGALYRVDTSNGIHPTGRLGPQQPPEFHPSEETIDAAIGGALAKPWQPLPLGLKPPSIDGVLTELHRQGIPNIPPSSPS
ncbi:hypothetical protein SAY87_017611 [Trapa incisa]|uniref:HTH myb-type domain-containing protein n=1 Tax=Trapa incisa TaxID=236973 RepID=A0AAN7QS16_9MYRT|nr:hypothetical protein SAY87_017611 [Trapa incisa]